MVKQTSQNEMQAVLTICVVGGHHALWRHHKALTLHPCRVSVNTPHSQPYFPFNTCQSLAATGFSTCTQGILFLWIHHCDLDQIWLQRVQNKSCWPNIPDDGLTYRQRFPTPHPQTCTKQTTKIIKGWGWWSFGDLNNSLLMITQFFPLSKSVPTDCCTAYIAKVKTKEYNTLRLTNH